MREVIKIRGWFRHIAKIIQSQQVQFLCFRANATVHYAKKSWRINSLSLGFKTPPWQRTSSKLRFSGFLNSDLETGSTSLPTRINLPHRGAQGVGDFLQGFIGGGMFGVFQAADVGLGEIGFCGQLFLGQAGFLA